MAAPTRSAFAALTGSTNTSSYAPSVATVRTGCLFRDVIWIALATDGNPTISLAAQSITDGWELIGQLADATNACKGALLRFRVVTDGVCPDPTINLSASESITGHSFRIRPSSDQNIIYSAHSTAQGSSTNPNPAVVTQNSGSTKDVLIESFWAGDGVVASTAAPTNYGNHSSQTISNAANGCSIGSADRTRTAVADGGTEDPGTFTRATEQWVAFAAMAWEVPAWLLAVADSTSASTSENVTLGYSAGGVALTVDDCVSGAASDNVTIGSSTALTVAACSSASETENVTVSYSAGGGGEQGAATLDFATDLNATVTSPVTSGSIANGGNLVTFTRTTLTYSSPVLQVTPPASTGSPALAITNNSYAVISLAGAGSLKRVRLKVAKGGSTSNRGFSLRSSHDSYASELVGVLDVPTVRPNLTSYDQAVDVPFTGGALTLRLYIHAPGSASTQEFDDIILDVETAGGGSISLSVADSVAASASEAVTIAPKTALVPDASVAASIVDSPVLAPNTALIPAASVSASVADTVSITPKTALVPASSVSAVLSDAVTIAPKTTLSVAAAVSVVLSDPVTVEPRTALSPASAVSASIAEAVTISFTAAGLAVQAAVSAVIADSPTLTSNYALTVASSDSAVLADAVSIASKVALAPAASVSASLSDSVALSLNYSVSVAPAVSASISDAVVISPKTALLASASASAVLSPDVTLATAGSLAVQASTVATEASGVVLAPRTSLAVNDAASATIAEAVALASAYGLVVSPSISPSIASSVVIEFVLPGIPLVTPAGRRSAASIAQVGGRRAAASGGGLLEGRTAAASGSLLEGRVAAPASGLSRRAASAVSLLTGRRA